MASTEKNLMAAFAGESQANRRYLAFARKAESEGHRQVARLFRAAAEAETVHALSHLRVAGRIGATQENLKEAVEGENFEFKSMYPEYIQIAKDEKEKSAEQTFSYANEVEKVHARLYQSALDALESGQDLHDTAYYVCPVCGYTVAMGEAEDRCPVCNTPKDRYTIVA